MPRIPRSFAAQSRHYFMREHVGPPSRAIDSPAAWLGEELAARESTWHEAWTEAQLDELERTLDEIETEGSALEELVLPPGSTPLLHTAARAWRETLVHGRGFVLVSGLPVERWSEERASLAFWIIGHALGLPGAQNAAGELLGHVVDYGEQSGAPNVRLYRTTSNIGLHCDAADVVGLLCLQTAAEGGASRIASSVAIFNALFEEAPELAGLLFEPFAVDRRDEQPPDQRPYFETPPCRFGSDGILRTFYHSEYFRSAQRLAEIGPLPADRLAVLDRYDAHGADPRFRLDMQLARGDIQLVSNHLVVHARTAYRDAESQKRHLLRLWLSLDDSESEAGSDQREG